MDPGAIKYLYVSGKVTASVTAEDLKPLRTGVAGALPSTGKLVVRLFTWLGYR